MESNLSILTTQDLELRHNALVLLDRASLAIGEKDRIGLVGRNGSGKSTFLKIVTGELAADAGAVTRQRGLVVGYLPQDFSLDPKSNVGENIRTGARHVLDLIKEFESLPGNSPRHAELEERIGHFGGWNLDHRISLAGARLNCPDADRDIDSLSGGEMRRVALARAIVGQPDLLVLDEPTNHLDTDSIEWVVEFLAVYPGAILVVTHDRFFLDRVANSIIELRHGQFERYAGNYTDYLMARADKLATEEVLEHKRQMFLRRELSWARRQPKARTTKSKGRLDRLGDVLDQDAPAPEAEMDLVIPPAPPLGNRVADIVNVGMQLAGRQLFSNLTLSFTKGSRIGITGRNGLGKTTLLRILIGNLAPTEGEVRVGQLTEFNYVDQGRLQLREDRTVLEEVSDGTEWVRWGDSRLSLRGYLKRFLFTDDRIVTLVKHLSGGERSRLLLARILKQGGNFLILDEPTNDLDLPTLRVLEEALLAFSGCVVVVSHDRYFLNRVCTGILAFEGDGRLVYSLGNFEDYSEKIRQRAPSLASEPIPLKSDSALPRPHLKAGTNTPVLRRRKLTFKERRELEEIEAIIQAAETEVQRIEDIFVSPDFYSSHAARTNDLLAELEAAKDKVGRLYARWEELETLQRAES